MLLTPRFKTIQSTGLQALLEMIIIAISIVIAANMVI